MRAQITLFFRSGLNTNKKGDILEGSKGLWFAATPEVNECSGFKKAGKRPALKGRNRWRKLFVKLGLFIFSLTLSFS